MSRCMACDKILSDSELRFRTPETGEFADLCTNCYRHAFDFIDDEIDSDYTDMLDCAEHTLGENDDCIRY